MALECSWDTHDSTEVLHGHLLVGYVIDRALAALPPVAGIVSAVRPDLPPVAGHTRRLSRMVEALPSGDAGPGHVVIEVSVRPGAPRDERIVGSRIIDQRLRPDRQAPEERPMTTAAIARPSGGTRKDPQGCHEHVTQPYTVVSRVLEGEPVAGQPRPRRTARPALRSA